MSAKTQLAVAQTTLSPLAEMSERLAVNQDELREILMQTVMPNSGKSVTPAQFIAFMAVANNYKLDPLKKEIYAFPGNGGTIQPIVSIDGWIRIIQSHPQFDGMVLQENFESGNLFSVTCTIHRKDRAHPTIITEYLSECARKTDNWQNKPVRMLRHKAAIQCGRYAFGLGGIMDEDEFERMQEREVNPVPPTPAASRTESLKNKLKPVDEETVIEGDPAPAADQVEQEPHTYATVAALINEAETTDALSGVVDTLTTFIATEGNEKFAEELRGLYSARMKALKGK